MSWYSFVQNYWRYYLSLEQEFKKVIDYVEFSTKNFTVYSIKLMQLLLSLGSEVDAVLKEICNIKNKDRLSIFDYAPIVFARYPSLISQEVCVFGRDLVLIPFSTWTLEQPSQSLPFWGAYNNVKHHRAERYNEASLEMVANSLTALFALNMYRLNEIYLEDGNIPRNIPEEESKLFYLKNWTERIKTSTYKHHYKVFDDDVKEYLL